MAAEPFDASWSRERKIEYVIDQLKEYQAQFSGKAVKATVRAFGRRGVGNSKLAGDYEDEFMVATTFDSSRLHHRGWTRHVPKHIPWPGVLVRQELFFDGKQVQEFHHGERGLRVVDLDCHQPPAPSGVMGYGALVKAIGLGPLAQGGDRLYREILFTQIPQATAVRMEERPELGEVLVCETTASRYRATQIFKFEPVCHWVGSEQMVRSADTPGRRVEFKSWLEYGDRFGHFIPESWGYTWTTITEPSGESGAPKRELDTITRQTLRSFELKDSVPDELFSHPIPEGVLVRSNCDEPPPAPVAAQAAGPSLWMLLVAGVAVVLIGLFIRYAVRKYRMSRATI